jgi:hypothetical protein
MEADKNTPKLTEKLQNMVNSELTMSVFRFVKGTAVFSAAATLGLGGALLVGAALLGLSFYRNRIITKNFKKELLAQYRPEIAHELGKSEESLTTSDVDIAAKIMGGGNNTVAQALIAVNRNEHTADWVSGVNAVVVTAVAITVPALLPIKIAAWIGTAVIGGFLSNAVSSMTEEVVHKMTGQWENTRINNTIRGITQALKIGTVSPEMVLNVAVEARPGIAQAIKARYKKPYKDLPFVEKSEAVEHLRDVFPAQAWADAFNANKASPNQLATAVFTNARPSVESADFIDAQTLELSSSSFAKRVTNERAHTATHLIH